MNQYTELYYHPISKNKLASAYTSMYGTSMGMCKSVADLNPELDIDNFDKYRVKQGVEEEIENNRAIFIAE